MTDRSLFSLAVVAALTLAGCGGPGHGTADSGASPDSGGWRLASGKVPTKAEFAAFAATCQDKGGAMDACLADLGLKRAP